MDELRYPVHGAGLGLRRTLMGPLADQPPAQVDFYEIAPENWIGVGGQYGKQFRSFTERYPFVCHGLSLSIGSPSPLDETFLHRVKRFLDEHQIRAYTEHLSYCSDDGHLYDLMPIPFTEEAVHYVAQRIRRTQDILERRIAMENVSYYAAPGKEMEEIDFINAVLEEADCGLLLDVNNIYVNSINHRYDAEEFLDALPAERVMYFHVAGHYNEAEDLIVDTHGADVIDPVWDLLSKAYARFGVVPTLLERDFNIPPLPELLTEVERISALQSKQEQVRESRHARHG
ncbi:HvfB family MNIO-type RiPP peptide maturase [Thiogranum longum]